ncbi:TPA: DUF3298/DUF4163 domain-containing protein [Candidatus Nomurabacteria bacterium]|nr:MAG: hypothetical protein O210_OD1C00001G0488 [Parcubacteria bacterium RAAC4_OD1_1]HCY26287.1 DUF3298/DUF4163 domain-containing protein [Candidatus Nomurabacteria bacterium]
MNKKYKSILIILSLLVIILIIILVFGKDDKIIPVLDDNISKVDSPLIVENSYETKTLNENDPYVKFDIKYPQFKQVDNSFNENISNLIKEQIKDTKEVSSENWQARYDTQMEGENIGKYPKTDDEKFYLYSDFNIIQSNPYFISFILTYGAYTGGAHGYEAKVSFNYDVLNKKVLMLKDVFSPSFNYLEYLSKESRDYLYKEYAEVKNGEEGDENMKDYFDGIKEMIDMGTEKKEENFETFTFTKEKIKIYFSQYQVGPYAIGMPEVEFYRK